MSGPDKKTLLYFVGTIPVAESGVLLPSGDPLTDDYLNSVSDEELDLLARLVSMGRGGVALEGFETDPRLRPAG